MLSSSSYAWLNDVGVELEKASVFEVIPDKTTPQLTPGPSQQLLTQQEARNANIEKIWGKVVPMSASRLVFYSQDLKQRTVVDFAQNRIDVSLRASSSAARATKLSSELEQVLTALIQVLNLTQHAAIEQLVDDLLLEQEDVIAIKAVLDDVLLLQDIFNSATPSADTMSAMASTLMLRARKTAYLQAGQSLSQPQHVTYEIPLPSVRVKRAAERIKPLAAQYALQAGVPLPLVMAIMHVESHFNPLAISPIPAYGLMQIVPATAGTDAINHLYADKAPELTADYLLEPSNNIQLGSTYLALVYYGYFAGVKDPMSRAYVTIAAYNAGPTTTSRAFVTSGGIAAAIPMINKLSSEEVLMRLLQHLPARETQRYVRKVLDHERFYRQ